MRLVAREGGLTYVRVVVFGEDVEELSVYRGLCVVELGDVCVLEPVY